MTRIASQDGFSQLLTAVYGAPTNPELWTVAIERLCRDAGIAQAALFEHRARPQSHKILAFRGDAFPDSGPLYEKHYWQFDEWTRRFPQSPIPGRVMRGQEVWPEEEFRRSVFYNEFLLHVQHRICEMACIGSSAAPGEFHALSIYRGPRDAPFSQEQLHLLARIAPHIKLALATRRHLLELENANRNLEAAFHYTPTAILILDSTGKATMVNPAAQAILDQRSGLLLANSRLEARSARENARLRALITQALGQAGKPGAVRGGSIAVPRTGRRPLHIFIAPLPAAHSDSPGRAAIVCLRDTDQPAQLPANLLQDMFHLTPAESRLALALQVGKSLTEAANTFAIGRETARTQLKSVLHKTGTRRQSELLQVLTTLTR